jgi:flagellar biosynthetic protein FliO
MPVSAEKLNSWLKVWKTWPRWAQVVSAGGLLALVALGLALNAGTGEANALNDPTGLVLEVSFKLLIVVVLIYGASLVLRRMGSGGWKASPRRLNVVETVHLSPRRALHLVQVGDRQLLIGATDQAITVLSEVEPAPLPGEQDTQAIPVGSFADVLSFSTSPAEPAVRS